MEYKQNIAGLELVPSGGGCFEIDVDGKQIYSKLETGSFPDEEQILSCLDDHRENRSRYSLHPWHHQVAAVCES